MTSPGDLLGDRYQLQSVIASGGMGRVWRAHDTLLQRPVAVKLLRSELTDDPAFLRRFRAEAQHAALLNDPHIAAVHDYGETLRGGETLAYLVMELVDGQSLSALLAAHGRLDVAQTLRIARQTAAALAVAHAAGVVHRDVKPGNVLLTAAGDVKITDFGIAWSASSVPLTRTGQVLGTPQYLAPEQAHGAPATPASDVYALGVVAYQCLSGRVPFAADSPVQVALMQITHQPPSLPPDVPADIRRLVERAMAKDPAARFRDGAALRDAVDALAGALPHTAAQRQPTAVLLPPGPTPPIRSAGPGHTRVAAGGRYRDTAVLAGPDRGAAPARRLTRRTWLLLAATVVAVLGMLAVVGLLGGTGEDAPATPPSGEATASTTAPATPTAVQLTAADLIGRPVGDVEADLTALGLPVQRRPLTTSDVPDGQVIAVDPVGQVAPGQTITVTYAAVPPPTQQNPRGGNGNGNGNGNNEDEGGDE